MKASTEASMKSSMASMEAVLEAFMEASIASESFHSFHESHGSFHGSGGSFHGSFHELPRKKQVVQETEPRSKKNKTKRGSKNNLR